MIISGFPSAANDESIQSIFGECGNIINIRPFNKAFVKFSSKNSFNKALELNGTEYQGQFLKIEETYNNNKNNGQNRNDRSGGFQNKNNYQSNNSYEDRGAKKSFNNNKT